MLNKCKKFKPKLFFKINNSAWKNYLFHDTFAILRNNSLSRDDLNYIEGDIKNIHYGDIHTKFKTLLDVTKETIPYINADKLEKVKRNKLCEVGDVIFADAAEDYEGIGKSIEIIDLGNQKVMSGLHTIIARRRFGIYTGFCGYLFQSWKLKKQIMFFSQGTKVLGLPKKYIEKINLDIPEIKEQEKITLFLSAVDKKIELLTKKHELLEKYKKGLMQKIFSQEMRFKQDDGSDFPDWRKGKLGELVKFLKGKGVSKEDCVEKGKYECIRYGELFTTYGRYINEIKSYTNKKFNVLSENNDVLMPTSDVTPNGLATASALRKSNVIIGGDILVIRSKDLFNVFFAYYISAHKNEVMRFPCGSTVFHIYAKDFSKFKVTIPYYEEQQKIASFLSAVDKKIDLAKQQIEKTQTFKKGLLQQMFV